ncbi:conserved hypothetical protein [Mycolicibacterium vanbaalenii PYR-1]|uniref:HNH endonuclease n=1 Tax=Mycolicibacterium vanbaalenii (strain DSM 7251 / JCM 13017 / BCRC 16820 / KCTC 9966 / NRRL B-24157 / PYR-1) TaxID=350058 RepID=A1TB50_MYCVP|nr:conserved hypothetical protein [Mycolicibacterium vanbaalenii PYR-1]
MPSRAGRAQPPPTGKRRTNKQRGVGWQHTQERERLLARHRDGRRCWWCAKPLYREPARNWDGEPLHADHTRPRSKGGTTADRLLHATCNRTRGDGSRDHQRPAADQTPASNPDDDLGPLAMPWPESFR